MASMISWLPILFMLFIFYFMLYKPQKRAREERDKMLSSLQVGARVITIGGIYGTIEEIYTETLKLKIAENVAIEIGRGAVSTIVEKENKATVE
ncbi:MAG: preprotein translocase subunit YajC [Selenomonadaceae bacterium]|nr:preprotein translocase subunit YajC [Selenomonadaceae bacterium]